MKGSEQLHEFQSEQQPSEQCTIDKWQNRICNALTLVGLVAIVVVGGSSVLTDVKKEITSPNSTTEEAAPASDVASDNFTADSITPS